MKPRYIKLAEDDQKARDRICEHLELAAWNHTLSRKLLSRLSNAAGAMIALIPEWVDLGQLITYSQGSVAPPGSPLYYAAGESPLDPLVDFAIEYLQSAAHSLIVCENSGRARKALKIWTWSRAPRASSLGDDEVYYILEPSDLDRSLIDAALGDSLAFGGVGVCSSNEQIPDGDMSDDSFLDVIAENAKHVLISAFDDDGYLIWSPAAPAH
jgi:hypothetical protein